MKANFVYVLLNTSKEKRNYNILSDLGFPQRFGFPVMVILDKLGNRIHTQNSEFLEKEKTYDEKVVASFLRHWSPAAIDPKSYQ
jgi:hypothetical protein